jgi:hypothetical protein
VDVEGQHHVVVLGDAALGSGQLETSNNGPLAVTRSAPTRFPTMQRCIWTLDAPACHQDTVDGEAWRDQMTSDEIVDVMNNDLIVQGLLRAAIPVRPGTGAGGSLGRRRTSGAMGPARRRHRIRSPG